MSDATATAKRALRADVRERRRLVTRNAQDAAATGVREQLDALVDRVGARSISCFLSTATEPGTREFVADAAARGIRVLLPVIRDDDRLDWSLAGDVDESGPFGLPEPVGERLGPEAVHDVDLMIVPAAAIDRAGMRLGWGRGYFDRTIGSMSRRVPVYAVVHDADYVEEVPSAPHDERVDGLVTPTRTITFPR